VTEYEFVTTRVEDGVCVLTLNRPDRLNAINRQLDLDWLHALQEAEADPEVRVVVQHGAGRMFSAGHDLAEVGQVIKDLAAEAHDWSKVYEFIWPEGSPLDLTCEYSKPIVSAVHGHVVGQAVFQVLATDLVVAAPGTVFNLEVMRTGGAAGAAAFSGLLPVKLVNEVALLGRLSAEQLLACGSVNRVVDDPLDEALRLASSVARMHPTSVSAYKTAMAETLRRRDIGDFKAAFDAIRDSHGNDDDNEFWAMAAERGVKEALAWRDAQFGPATISGGTR
jgi:enoyl-CoA hydratase